VRPGFRFNGDRLAPTYPGGGEIKGAVVYRPIASGLSGATLGEGLDRSVATD